MKSDLDPTLEQLCQRPWKFLAQLSAIPQHHKDPLGEVMEAYIRQAYYAGQRTALEELLENSAESS